MIKTERAKIAQKILNKIYPNTPIPLNHKSTYELLIAVLLSAQCTDERVNKVTPQLFELANTPEKMAKIPTKKIYSIVKPCGLGPKKSKAIRSLSILLVKKYAGKVPANLLALEELPGVGHKTASVVMSQGYGHPAFPVDTHIHRLAQRWGLTSGRNVKKTEEDLKSLYHKKYWNKLHLQIIFYGREYCTARGCDGTKCFLCKKLYPNRKKKFIAKKA